MKLRDMAGSWALVSGASSGIGREFCVQLAAAGADLVLVARRQELLDELAAELGRRHGVRCAVVAIDLTEPNAPARLKARLDELKIHPRLLVNNAGSGHWGVFSGATPAAYEKMMTLNVVVPTLLSRVFHDDLVANSPSGVINVSSPAVFQPVPYMAAYAASKAALHSLSLALSEEWRSEGIHVQTLVPAPTESEFDARAGAYESQLDSRRDPPATVVARSLAALETGEVLVSTAKGTYQQRFFGALFPAKFVVAKVAEMFRPKKP